MVTIFKLHHVSYKNCTRNLFLFDISIYLMSQFNTRERIWMYTKKKRNLLLNSNVQLNRRLSFSCENINDDESISKKDQNLLCMHRQQVKQLGHQTRSTTIYQKSERKKEG